MSTAAKNNNTASQTRRKRPAISEGRLPPPCQPSVPALRASPPCQPYPLYMNCPTPAKVERGLTQQTGILELLAIIYCSEAPTI